MPFLISPGVAVVEKDFSSIVPAVSSSAGAFAGPFTWGPIEDPVRVSSETELVTRFGTPTSDNYKSFFTAANFLGYANNLLVSRSNSAGSKNAVAIPTAGVLQAEIELTSAGSGYATGTPGDVPTVTFSAPTISGSVTATGVVTYTDSLVSSVLTRIITGVTVTNAGSGYTIPPTMTITAPAGSALTAATARVKRIISAGTKVKNVSHYLTNFANGTGVYGPFAAKFAGTKGNGLKIVVVDNGNWNVAIAANPSLSNILGGQKPGTSTYASSRGIINDEVHVAIFDTAKGDFSGVAGTLLESYTFLSKISDAKGSDGASIYWKTAINSKCKYVWWMDNPLYSSWSEPTSSDVVLTSGAAAVINATLKTITISEAIHLPSLAAFKLFWDTAADKTSRQIALGGTASNNFIYTIANIETIGTPITGYKITLVETPLATETVADILITSVPKATWGLSADAVVAWPGNNDLLLLKAVTEYTLSGGADDYTVVDADIIASYALFTNSDQYDISLVLAGNCSPVVAKYIVDNIADARRDCVAFLSPNVIATGEPILSIGSDATTAIIDYRNATQVFSSYAVIDSGSKYQYDRYNDAYRWIPLNGDTAGLCARTDFTADPWYSPGGFNRGQIKNVIKLAFNPNQTERDVLYSAGVNPVVSFPGQGTILYGDKTMLAKPSAFDRINVRRLFIVLEKSIAVAAKYQMFEFNDSFTRAQFKNLVEPFLRDVQGRRGVTDFRVKCDDTNNTGEVIDSNRFVADIFIKPNRSINFITLNFVAARSSVSFEEIGA